MRLTEPGIYFDVAASDYFDDPCPEPSFTQSISKVLLERSPAHARLEHPRLAASAPVDAIQDGTVEKYDKARAIGDAAHAKMIGRGKQLAVADFDSWRSGDAKKFRAAAEAEGKSPILVEHHGIACAMVEAAYEQLAGTEHAMAFDPANGDGEVVLAWQEEATWLRTMIDWRVRSIPRCYDYKTTGLSCAPHIVVDRPGELGWDIQNAMHERGLDVLEPANIGRREFFVVNQEHEPPFALTVIRISESDLTLGRKKLAVALDMWRECMTSGIWPLYPRETVLSHPRGWSESRWLEREVAMEARRQHPAFNQTQQAIMRSRGPMLTDHLSGG